MDVIKIIRKDDLVALKNNIEEYKGCFLDKDNTRLFECYGKNPLIDSKYQINRFEVDMTSRTPFETEFNNVKTVHERLDFLTRSQASDERIWTGLCLTYFWEYTKYRWNIDGNPSSENILNHFFFNYSSKRSLTRNAVARLWWIGEMTYDEDNSDPYELTRFVCRKANFIFDTLERNTSNNSDITKAFLRGAMKAEKSGYELTKKSFSDLAIYLNIIGGTHLLDTIPSSLIEERIFNYAMKMGEKDGI